MAESSFSSSVDLADQKLGPLSFWLDILLLRTFTFNLPELSEGLLDPLKQGVARAEGSFVDPSSFGVLVQLNRPVTLKKHEVCSLRYL